MKTVPPDLNTLLASLGYLMTRYALRASPDIARAIVHHLEMVLAHSQSAHATVAEPTYRSLLLQWRTILARHETDTGQACGGNAYELH